MKWTDYTTKETLEDNDELMILDADVKANKRTLMSKIWNYVVDKMTSAVVAKLTTTDKTVLGAINELNSNILAPQKQIEDLNIDISKYAVRPSVMFLKVNFETKNKPNGVTGYAINFVWMKGEWQVQLFISDNATTPLMIRTCNGYGEWGTWTVMK